MKITLQLASFVCAAAVGHPAMAQEENAKTDLSSWDMDRNNSVSLEEWDAAIEEHGLFDNLDRNNNGIFDMDEAVESVAEYDIGLDIDDGGNVDRDEFTVGLFHNQDSNNDDRLDESEFSEFASKAESTALFTTN